MSGVPREWVVLFGGAGREAAIDAMNQAAYTVRAVVVPQLRSDKLQRSLQSLRRSGFEILEVEKGEVESSLSAFAGIGLLSLGFPYILDSAVLQRHPIRLNVHPTLLPDYRGPTSGAHVIMEGQQQTGSTVHLMEDEADAGDIVAQSSVDLDRFDTLRSMQRKVYETEPGLVLKALARLDRNEPTLPQSAGKWFRSRVPEDSEIDPTRPLIDLFDEIRSCDPEDFPAFFKVDGQKVCIRLWRPEKNKGEEDRI